MNVNTESLKPNFIDAFLEDVLPVFPYLGQWVINFSVDIGVAIVHPFKLFMKNQLKESPWILTARVLITGVRYPVQLLLTVGSILLNSIASLINNLTNSSYERALNEEELAYLKPVFKDSVRYDQIRLQFNGVKEKLRISPQAVGNDIFMRKNWWGVPIVTSDGTLTPAGLRLLGHEVAHVWQYQNTGAGYMGDSLMTQVLDYVGKKIDIPLSDGYNLHTAIKEQRPLDECNVEQQAVMAELIAAAICEGACGELNLDAFNKVSGYELSRDEFTLAQNSQAWFEAKA